MTGTIAGLCDASGLLPIVCPVQWLTHRAAREARWRRHPAPAKGCAQQVCLEACTSGTLAHSRCLILTGLSFALPHLAMTWQGCKAQREGPIDQLPLPERLSYRCSAPLHFKHCFSV